MIENNIPGPSSPATIPSRASVDTIEVFARHLPRGFRRRVEAILGRRVMIDPRRNAAGYRVGYLVAINQPPAQILATLNALISDRACRAVISRLDTAFDFTTDDPDALIAWLDQHIVLKWRSPKAHKTIFGTTVYWCDKHKGRNIAVYRKRPGVVRLELRFFRARTVERSGLSDLSRLPSINPKKVFDRHIKGRRLTEKYLIKVMRKVVSDDIEWARKNPTKQNGFIDHYRSRIANHAASIMRRIDGQGLGVNASENLSLSFLRIPDRLEWPVHGTPHRSGHGGH